MSGAGPSARSAAPRCARSYRPDHPAPTLPPHLPPLQVQSPEHLQLPEVGLGWGAVGAGPSRPGMSQALAELAEHSTHLCALATDQHLGTSAGPTTSPSTSTGSPSASPSSPPVSAAAQGEGGGVRGPALGRRVSAFRSTPPARAREGHAGHLPAWRSLCTPMD